jgi:integrase
MHRGIDVRAERRALAAAEKRSLTLRQAAAEFLNSNASLRVKSKSDYEGSLRFFKDWMDWPLKDITREMVEDRHKKIAAEVHARNPLFTGHSSANGAMRTLRAIWNFAADKGYVTEANPVRLRKHWFNEPRREGHIRPEDLAKFYAAVQNLPNDVARDYLILLLFTGLRRGEAASLTWDDIDFEHRVLRIPGQRTKSGRKHALPLSDVVFDVLSTRRALGNTHYVFPAVSATGHIAEPKFPLALAAKASGVKVTCHDLRRTFVTIAESCGLDGYALKALVNHSIGNDVTGGYVQMTAERLREPLQKVTDKLKRYTGTDRNERLEGERAASNRR